MCDQHNHSRAFKRDADPHEMLRCMKFINTQLSWQATSQSSADSIAATLTRQHGTNSAMVCDEVRERNEHQTSTRLHLQVMKEKVTIVCLFIDPDSLVDSCCWESSPAWNYNCTNGHLNSESRMVGWSLCCKSFARTGNSKTFCLTYYCGTPASPLCIKRSLPSASRATVSIGLK